MRPFGSAATSPAARRSRCSAPSARSAQASPLRCRRVSNRSAASFYLYFVAAMPRKGSEPSWTSGSRHLLTNEHDTFRELIWLRDAVIFDVVRSPSGRRGVALVCASTIALGYPLGTPGARLMSILSHHIRAQNLSHGVQTMSNEAGWPTPPSSNPTKQGEHPTWT